MNLEWVLESVDHPRFPYRLSIRQGGENLLVLRVQDRWPGQKGHIFCLREKSGDFSPTLSEVERVKVISFKRYGKRISVVLDRGKEKRCDFLFLTKKYKSGEGEYEQIFWRTQAGLLGNKPRLKLSTYHKGEMDIIVDIGEKYPWTFPDCNVEKDRLPVGDYALKGKSGIIAIVERKTFDNFVAEFSKMQIFHQQLGELSSHKHSALLIEANYADFFKPGRLKYYPPVFAAKAIGELYAFHPALSIIFAGNRKLANEWTYRFFSAVRANNEDNIPPSVSETIAKYEYQSSRLDYFGLKDLVRKKLPEEDFNLNFLKKEFPFADRFTLRKILYSLKKKGMIIPASRHGFYRKVDAESVPNPPKNKG